VTYNSLLKVMQNIIQELMLQDYESARSTFKGFDFQVVIRATIEGSSPGKIWVDDTVQPECAIMAAIEGWFLAGNPSNNKFNQSLKRLVHNMILRANFYSPVNPEFLR